MMNTSRVLSCVYFSFYLGPTGASDFPHSRQDDLEREVINPQNGHIRCAAKPRTGGASEVNRFETEALIWAIRLRTRSLSRRKSDSIAKFTFRCFLLTNECFVHKT